MKHCQRCNLDYQSDHRFCAKCGGALAERVARPEAAALCAACGGTLRPEWSFCGHCRAPVARTSTQPLPYRPGPAFVEPAQGPLTPCPSCRQPMEEGGGFCEHCGARVCAETSPAPAAHAAGSALDRRPAGDVGGGALQDASTFQPLSGQSAEEFEENEEFEDEEEFAGDGEPEVFAGEAYKDGGRDAVEDDTSPHDVEAPDEADVVFEADEGYEESVPDPIPERPGAASAEYEQVTPAAYGQSDGSHSHAPRPIPYSEPRTFAYGQPLPTFGPDEEAETTPAPAARAGRKWIIIGGTGLAALALVVAAAVLFRQPSAPDTPPPPVGAAVNVEDTPATAQPAPPEGMVYVPGGKFFMGRDGGDDYERPRHEVAVAPFFIDKYEVTREEYQKFVDVTGRAPSGWVGRKFPPGTGRWPITGVTWADAVAYAKWGGKRLPTEAEWEYAARGTDGRIYPWGDQWQVGMANADNSARGGMAPVGEHKGASPFGLFDMVGNAWEWTSSTLQAYPGGRLPKQEGRDLRVIRGGSWQSDRGAATTTYRWGWPAEGGEDYSNTSFRCVKDVVADKR